MFELSVFFKERLVARASFATAAVRIGRAVESEVQIDEPGVSRLHATIEDLGPAYLLRDAGSPNGLFVNGERVIGHRALNDLDRIALGRYKLVFHAPRPAPARRPLRDADAKETDVAPIGAELRERPCPFVASLVVAARTPREPAQLFELARDVVVVGSAEGSDLVLAGAPPRAAAIVRGWRGFQLVALAPGVAKNGEPVPDRAELGHEDVIELGATRVVFVAGRADLLP